MTETNEILEKFKSLGMSEQKAKETLKNANVTNNLLEVLKTIPDMDNLNSSVSNLLYQLATKIKPQIRDKLPFIGHYITSLKLDTPERVDAAMEYLLMCQKTKSTEINVEEFEKACGIGVTVTPEDIERVVLAKIKKHKSELLEKRYHFNSFKIMQEVRAELKWADPQSVKKAIDVEMFYLLGPKTEEDIKPLAKDKKKEKPKPKPVAEKTMVETLNEDTVTVGNARTIAELMKSVRFHKPGENYKTDGYIVTDHTERLLKEHLRQTGGRVQTRFPPEPNGILHIGHAKAININFGYAAANNGICYLRYDDTNPEKEEEKFFVGIKDMVEWLGYKPYRITHSSDYFDQLYEWAVQLIRRNLAYVCHQRPDEMKGIDAKMSPWRERPMEESLRLFEMMKDGLVNEGDATLRMKIILEEGKMDPVAYRIKFLPHHRTGDKWCIYPTYDFTHCLCDSIENITHSLCTKEFQSRRSSYYWLCNALNIYCPVQWEYGRLNMNYTVVSKRKIAQLINGRFVKDWDDPRLFTLTALRRRGFPAEAINNFCAQLGVTGAQMSVDPSMLEACVRDVLNVTAPRRLVVINPIRVYIRNFPHKEAVKINVPHFPQKPEAGTYQITLDRFIYIDLSDFSEKPEKGYRRLCAGQPVGLRYADLVITLVNVEMNEDEQLVRLVCDCAPADKAPKPKAFIQWVSNPVLVELRMYEPLFKHKNPENPIEVPGGFLSDINMNSLKSEQGAIDAGMLNFKPFEQYQFERIGYFSVDPDSTGGNVIFNRTVTLKEDPGKV